MCVCAISDFLSFMSLRVVYNDRKGLFKGHSLYQTKDKRVDKVTGEL